MPEIGLKTVNGVAEMDGTPIARFLDTEGNILNIAAMWPSERRARGAGISGSLCA